MHSRTGRHAGSGRPLWDASMTRALEMCGGRILAQCWSMQHPCRGCTSCSLEYIFSGMYRCIRARPGVQRAESAPRFVHDAAPCVSLPPAVEIQFSTLHQSAPHSRSHSELVPTRLIAPVDTPASPERSRDLECTTANLRQTFEHTIYRRTITSHKRAVPPVVDLSRVRA